MTSRERQASGGVGVVERPATARPAPNGPAPAPSLPLSWSDLFHHLSPTQHAEVLELAVRQGLVQAHQLPATEARRAPLSLLLGSRLPELAPVEIEPRPLADDALDDWQRQAVWRAVQTPDLCLIHGGPGTGKTRIIAEILHQLTSANQRVLLVAPGTAAVDAALARVQDQPGIYAVRCLGPGESAASLSPDVRGMHFGERVRKLREDAVRAARQNASAAESCLAALHGQASAWERFASQRTERDNLASRRLSLEERRRQINAEVEAEVRALSEGGQQTAPLAEAIREAIRCRDEARAQLARLRAEVAEARAELVGQKQGLEAERARLEPLQQAQQANRWWTPAWWRARAEADLSQRLEQITAGLAKLDQDEQLLQSKARSHDEQEARGEAEAREKLASLMRSETERRRREIDSQLDNLDREQVGLGEEWQALAESLSSGCRPAADTPEALDRARESWQAECDEAIRRRDFAQRWAATLEAIAPTWPDRLGRLVNVVGAPLAALASDPHFGDRSNSPPFDVLIVDEAENLTEVEFQALARRARRWVLVGELPADPPPDAQRRNGAVRGRPAFVRPGVFQRLWQPLHTDPGRLSVRWERDRAALCCRLRPIPADQERWIETEPVLDRADVQLRIVAPPRSEPVLAEVVFPPQTSIEEAKRFIFQELQELAIQTAAPALHWQEDPERLWLRFADLPQDSDQAVALEDGVFEWVRRDGPAMPLETLAVEFRKAAGWDRDRARAWLTRHSRLRDLGRTVVLSRLHRMTPALAAAVSDLFGQAPATSSLPAVAAWGCWKAPLVFIPVPGLRTAEGRRPARGSAQGTVPRAARFEPRGAGLELDLADTTHPPQLPADVRQQLPARGLVNLMEAQAVVRTVEALVSDPTFRSEALAVEDVPLVVVALYPAQSRLIELLLRRSDVLAHEGVEVAGLEGPSPADGARRLRLEVGTPSAWRQRECLGLLVSLTRSHSHRAVQIGDQEGCLALALTRARGRIVLLGDPGTLVRRSQWQGAVDQLDEAAAARERELVGRLVHHLQGPGSHPEWFQLCEGSSA